MSDTLKSHNEVSYSKKAANLNYCVSEE